MADNQFVHGYSHKEALILNDQEATLDRIIHGDKALVILFPKDSVKK